MKAIFKREFNSYFTSPIGYIFLGCSLIFAGIVFYAANLAVQSPDMSSFFSMLIYLYIFVTPVLTMRLISDDRRNKTDQLLLTSPVSVTSVVLGKFFAAVALLGIFLLILFIYPLILQLYGTIQLGYVINMFGGYLLLGCALFSIGLFVSSLTESQVTAAIVTLLVMLFMFFMINVLVNYIGVPFIAKAVSWFAIMNRFTGFGLGYIDLSSVVYYISITAVFVFLTVQSIEKKRWI